MMKPRIRLKISDVKVVPLEILSRNQEDLEKIKRQKREWYHRNKKKVLKQQKTSERKKEYLKEWYLKKRQEKIRKSLQWTRENSKKKMAPYTEICPEELCRNKILETLQYSHRCRERMDREFWTAPRLRSIKR